VDCYVAKRNSVDFVNPNLSSYLKDKKRAEIKIRKWQFSEKKRQAKLNGKHFSQPKEHELYVVCFTTRQTKTNVLDKPRAIECEVINTKINKKEYDRKIIINGLLNYDKEMEWIAPIKFAESVKNAKAVKQAEKTEQRKQAKITKQKIKAKNKVEKAKTKGA
jgi:hypothetical protein